MVVVLVVDVRRTCSAPFAPLSIGGLLLVQGKGIWDGCWAIESSPHTPVLAQVCPQRVTPCFRTLGLFFGIIIFVVPKLPEDSLYFVRGSFVGAAGAVNLGDKLLQ